MRKYYNRKRVLSNYPMTTNTSYVYGRKKRSIRTRIKGRILMIYNKIRWG